MHLQKSIFKEFDFFSFKSSRVNSNTLSTSNGSKTRTTTQRDNTQASKRTRACMHACMIKLLYFLRGDYLKQNCLIRKNAPMATFFIPFLISSTREAIIIGLAKELTNKDINSTRRPMFEIKTLANKRVYPDMIGTKEILKNKTIKIKVTVAFF